MCGLGTAVVFRFQALGKGENIVPIGRQREAGADAIGRCVEAFCECVQELPRRGEPRKAQPRTLPGGGRDAGIEAVRIVSHGDDEGEQLLFSLLGSDKAVERDAAGLQMHAGGQAVERLVHDGGGSFDEHARLLFLRAVQPVENRVQAVPALHFERHGLARGEPAEMADDFFPVGKSVFADGPADERPQYLLSAAAADAERKFHGRAVHPGEGSAWSCSMAVSSRVYQTGLSGTR